MAKESASNSDAWWQLRIELLDVEPRVWRRVVVPVSITLPKLHGVIQASLGWTNSHLHEFVICGVRYSAPDPDFARELGHVNEKNVKLSTALGPNARSFDYIYDFGDDWHHVVLVEDQFAQARAVQCIAGENACPPEDVGGPHGYARFLEAIADPKHDEHREMLDWVGGAFDASKFDLDSVNRSLKEV